MKRNPVLKSVRTPRFKMQVVRDKTKYNRKDNSLSNQALTRNPSQVTR